MEVMDESFIEPKRNKKKGLIVLLIILIVLIVGVLSVAIFNKFTNKNSFKVLINNVFDYVEENIYETDQMNGSLNFRIVGTTSSKEKKEIFKILNNIDVSIDYVADYKNRLVDIDYKINYYGDKLLNFNFYVEENNSYIYLEDLYDKYIKYDTGEYNEIFSSIGNEEDYKIILSSVRKNLNEVLKEEYFTKAKEEVNGEEVTKTVLKLDETNQREIEKEFLSLLLEDEKFLNSYAKVNKKDVSEIKSELEEKLQNVETEDYEEVTISLYTDYTRFVKIEIEDNEDKIVISKDRDNYKYSFVIDEDSYSGDISITKKGDDDICKFNIKNDNTNDVIKITMSGSMNNEVKELRKDISNNVNYSEMTDEEFSMIGEKLLDNEAFIKIFQDVYSNNLGSEA